MDEDEVKPPKRIISRFKNNQGDVTDLIDLPANCTPEQLTSICNAILQQEDNTPYLFFVNEIEVKKTLSDTLDLDQFNSENVLEIIYEQQAIFRVRAVSRCSSTLPGHAEAVISCNFSANGLYLASGSGDTTVRFWDIHTQTPEFVCKSHTNWVLCIAWSPDSKKLASADKNGKICIWDPKSGKNLATLGGHKQWVTALAWEPFHLNTECRKLASSSKDCTIRIWDVVTGFTLLTLSGHDKSVTCLRWGGSGLIYSGSQDRTVKVWRAKDGVLCRSLEGHAHWVNTLALSTDYVLRTGYYNPGFNNPENKSITELEEIATHRYKTVCPTDEKLVSGSDDFTLFLWSPEKQKTPIARLTGHQQLVNDVKFSPDARIIASASFDKSIKLWDGVSGKFLGSLRGHVQAVYVIAWSADSRLLVSGSADSTLKVWNVKDKKIELDLPGHADQVFAVDWSPNGTQVASGGKDKVLKLWAH